MNGNEDNKHVPKTKEEKEAFKAQKLLAKQNRKEKSLLKSSNKTEECESVKSVQKLPTAAPISNKLVKGASDMVSFSETSVKFTSSRSQEEKSPKTNTKDQNVLIRPQESKRVTGFDDLYYPDKRGNLTKSVDQIPNSVIHPDMKKLGLELDSYKITGSTLRCQKFLDSLKQMTVDIAADRNETFSHTFAKALDYCVDFLGKCRPLSVTMRTAIDYLKLNLSLLNEPDHEKCRKSIIDMIDQFLNERIDMAHEHIKTLTADYIKPNQNILVYSYSQIVSKSLLHAWGSVKSPTKTATNQIFVVETFPESESERMSVFLKSHDIPHTRINLSAVPRVMVTVDLVILGAHSVMSNSSVVSRSGSASIANTAKSFGKKVIVCAETLKFTQSDCTNFNELNNPDLLVAEICKSAESSTGAAVAADIERVKNWRDIKSNITVLDLLYDVIPGSMISGVCCELGIVSPTAVSYVYRVKQPFS